MAIGAISDLTEIKKVRSLTQLSTVTNSYENNASDEYINRSLILHT